MDCVNAAIEKVKEQYPTAMLYEAEGRSTIGPPILKTSTIFTRPEDSTTIFIKSNNYDEFEKPLLINQSWDG